MTEKEGGLIMPTDNETTTHSVYFEKAAKLPESVKRKLSIHDFQTIYKTMVVPALEAAEKVRIEATTKREEKLSEEIIAEERDKWI